MDIRNLKIVTLAKRVTADGTDFIYETVPIGEKYMVDLASIETINCYNTETKKVIPRACIFVYNNDYTPEGWIPVELLNIPVELLNME